MSEIRRYLMQSPIVGASVEYVEARDHDAEVRRYDLALQSLTPGGSEFVRDPERCVEFVRQARDEEHKALMAAKAKVKRMREAGDKLRDALNTISDEMDVNFEAHPSWPWCVKADVALFAWKEAIK